MAKDAFKHERRKRKPGYSNDFPHTAKDKAKNRRAVRKNLKRNIEKE